MRNRAWWILACLLMAAQASAQSADQLLNELSLFGSARFISMQVQMDLTLANGTKSRTLDVFIRRERVRTRGLSHVVSPGFLSSMKFLSLHEGGQESSWIKTSDGVRRLTDANGSERIFDSDFRAEDFMTVSVSRFSFAFLPDASIDGLPCIVIEARPRDAAGYARKLFYIGKADLSLRGMDYLDSQGQLLRRYRMTASQSLAGSTAPLTAEMVDLRAGTSTTLKVLKADVETPLPDSLFSRGTL